MLEAKPLQADVYVLTGRSTDFALNPRGQSLQVGSFLCGEAEIEVQKVPGLEVKCEFRVAFDKGYFLMQAGQTPGVHLSLDFILYTHPPIQLGESPFKIILSNPYLNLILLYQSALKQAFSFSI